MTRPQAVVLPILREALPGASVVSVIPDVDYRTFPLVVIRREGGTRNPNLPHWYGLPVLEMTAVSADGLVDAEELYDEALEALFDAVKSQTVVAGVGYLQSIREDQGPTQIESPFADTWVAQGTIRLGVRSSAA